MKQLKADAIQLLKAMVTVPSLTFEEDKVADLIFGKLSEWGIQPYRLKNNIWCVNALYDSGKPTLALDAHIDTVKAADSYTRDPFDPGDDPATVYGLGSNDDGGSVVAMIAAFRYFYNCEMPVNLALTLSSEEERSGSEGAQLLYGPDGPEELRTAKWVIVGEPTGMKAATSERGLLVLDGLAEGVSGHAARNEGVNALYIALEDIEKLRSFDFDRVSPVMGKVKLTVTQINAGTAHNVVPDKCSFVVDIRPTEQYDNAEIVEMLQKVCKSRLTPRNLKNRSSVTPVESELYRTVGKLGIETYSSPTTSDWIRMHTEAIKMGPGESSRSHRADEFIKVSEIEEAVDKYIEFIECFYGNIME